MLYDSEPVPKVIDFGVAKVAGQQTRGAWGGDLSAGRVPFEIEIEDV